MVINGYKNRIIDKEIEENLKIFGAVCIEGPKWCGKTWTSRFHSNSEYLVGDSKNNFANKKLAMVSVNSIFDGEKPRLIDEWQEVPEIWDAVRSIVDKDKEKGKFILTGSTVVDKNRIMHSGAGRIARIKMQTMSLFESSKSSGKVSLKNICEGNYENIINNDITIEQLIDYVLRGGWPESQDLPLDLAMKIPNQYIEAILENDVDKIDDVVRDKTKLKKLLRSLARNESTTASIATIVKDIDAIDGSEINRETISDYINVLKKLFLIDNQQPFSSKLRSSVRIRQKEKRHFIDQSLAASLLGATPNNMLYDLETFGFLFEAMCERDLKIYARNFGANVYHYQDYENNEIDAVVELQNGEYSAFEIKLGTNQIEEAAKNLINIKNKIAKDKKKTPKSLCIICGMSNAAYLREDGVYVVPITALKP